MRAVVNTHYGSPDVLQIQEVPTPKPEAGEVLVRVHATTVSRTDDGMLRPKPPVIGRLMMGLFRPKYTTLGMDFAGTVAAIGTGVTDLKPGDRVFGMSEEHYGAHAEYLCVSQAGAIATMPEGLGFHESVVCEGAWYANTYLQRFDLEAGDTILIYGASGAIGTAAVQLAKSAGAQVTAVVGTRHVELAQSLGADHVIDYMQTDFAAIGETFDFVFDAVGKTTFFQCRNVLKPGGVFSASDLGPWWQNIFLSLWSSITGSNRVVMPMPKNSRAAVELIQTLLEVGSYRAVVDRTFSFEEISDAYRYVETEEKTGIVVINVAPTQVNA